MMIHSSLTGALLLLASSIAIAARDKDAQTYKSTNLVSTAIKYTKTAATAPGYLFIEPVNGAEPASTGPTIITDEGELIWRLPYAAGGSNFNMQELNGKQYLTFWDGEGASNYGFGYGAVIFLDNTYTQKYNICASDLDIVRLPQKTSGSGSPCLLDLHESRVTPYGSLLATVRNVTRADMSSVGGPKDGYVLDSVFVDIDIVSGKYNLIWSAVDHLDQLDFFALSETPPGSKSGSSIADAWDFMHMNSVASTPDPQAGYIFSARYLDSAIKLDMQGNVEWFLKGGGSNHVGGNFTLPSNAGFRYEHDIVPYNVTSSGLQISMFNNNNIGSGSGTAPSSGLELALNTNDFTVTVVRRLSPAKRISSYATGSYQALPGFHALVDYGHPGFVNEFDGDNNIIYSAYVSNNSDYRAYKYEWTGNPATNPSVYAEAGYAFTNVYVSWNGATEVANWAFSLGYSENALEQQSQQYSASGFETHATFPERGYIYVTATALDASGKTIGTSDVVQVTNAYQYAGDRNGTNSSSASKSASTTIVHARTSGFGIPQILLNALALCGATVWVVSSS